jgi:cytochrome P450
LRSIFYYVLKDPRIYARLQQEIDEADAQGRLSPSVTFAESNTLPYLIAVIRESMRIHPSVQLSMPRVVPPSGATICGEYFPPGVIVGCNPYIIHRDRRVFGEDADEFHPERWLDEKRAKEMDKAIITFGSGTRTCVGKNISLMEMHKLVPQLLRYFDFSLADKDAEWTTLNRWFNSQKGLKVNIRLRKKVDMVPEWQNPEEKTIS